MFRFLLPVLACALSLFAYPLSVAHPAEPIKGIGPVGKVELVKDNFQFLEGPTRAPDGSLYFTDIPQRLSTSSAR